MRLYALCDQDMLQKYNVSFVDFVNIAKKCHAEIIQLRMKNATLDEAREKLLQLKKNYNGKIIINDFYELIDLCDGVHLGQEDIEKINKNKHEVISDLRKISNEKKIIGLSTHNQEEILEANSLDLDYIGLGAYRDTTTKDITNVLGNSLDDLASLSKHKVAAIGGVTLNDKFQFVTYSVIGSGLLK